MWTLHELPDCKSLHHLLSVGGKYEVLQVMGNGFVIQTSDPEIRVVVLQSRFTRDA